MTARVYPVRPPKPSPAVIADLERRGVIRAGSFAGVNK